MNENKVSDLAKPERPNGGVAGQQLLSDVEIVPTNFYSPKQGAYCVWGIVC